jgi:isopenicillin-N epimerase
VDGAHAFNHIVGSDVTIGCDAYGTSLYKWTSGPIGTGMLYVRKDRIKDVWPLMAAPESMDANIRKFEENGW